MLAVETNMIAVAWPVTTVAQRATEALTQDWVVAGWGLQDLQGDVHGPVGVIEDQAVVNP